MTKRSTGRRQQSSPSPSPAAALSVADILDRLAAQGDMSAIEVFLKDFAGAAELPPETLSRLADQLRERVAQGQSRLAHDLRLQAESERCEVELRSPYVSIGCVTLKEGRPTEWSVSVLDNVVIATIKTTDGRVLANRAIEIIHDIETRLKQTERFVEDLLAARDIFGSGATIPANALMVLCAQGRPLRRLLRSADLLDASPGISRAAFGYLLGCVADGDAAPRTPVKLRFSVATQSFTAHPYRFVAVPDNCDPRRRSHAKLIAGVTLVSE